jgi:hypothetical protein
MAPVASVLAWTVLLLQLCGATAAAVKDIKSVYDDLTDYGLPIGLLPDSVINYSLSADGKFTVELEEPCYAKFQEQVYYNKKIQGELVAGAILNLSGIQAKQLFLWLPVTGIHVDPESPAYIYFEVGALSKKLSIALFDAPPRCDKRTSSESTRVTDFFDSTVKMLLGEKNHPRKALQ